MAPNMVAEARGGVHQTSPCHGQGMPGHEGHRIKRLMQVISNPGHPDRKGIGSTHDQALKRFDKLRPLLGLMSGKNLRGSVVALDEAIAAADRVNFARQAEILRSTLPVDAP